MATVTFSISTDLVVSAEEAWRHATSVEGIAYELAPWLAMTFPGDVAHLTPETVPIGERLCRSWLLVGGVVPVDFDDVTIVELEPGRRFLERSTMLSVRRWEHERLVEPRAQGSRVTDRLAATPRRLVPEALARAVMTALFRHRHRRLAAKLGRSAGSTASSCRG